MLTNTEGGNRVKETRARRPKIRSLVAALASALIVAGLLPVATSPSAEAQQQQLPVVFVHGLLGSGGQFESQAMRFASQGWPAERVRAFDYDTANQGGTPSSALGGFVDDILAEFGVSQVHMVGHSLGTIVGGSYVSANSGKIATYTAVDGLPAICLTARCQTITAASMGQSHVEATTSPEAFATMYEFMTGSAPSTTDILPGDGPTEIAGRAVNLQVNTGVAGATLELWPIDPATGHRTSSAPMESTTIDASGDFGPWQIEAGDRYELALTGDGTTIHYYKQPWIRSDYIVRLNSSGPDSATGQATNRGPNHVTTTAVRYREWWADGNEADILAIFTQDSSGQVVEQPVDAMQGVSGNATAGLHIHDDTASPQQSTLGPLPGFGAFQAGVDVYMPAEADAGGTVTFVSGARGMYDMPSWQALNAPNWPSDSHHVIFEFNDFVQ